MKDWGQEAVSGDEVLMDGRRLASGRDWVAEVREPDNCRPQIPAGGPTEAGLSTVHVVLVLTDSPPREDKEVGTGNCLHWELSLRP